MIGSGVGQQDAAEDLEEARAVDLRRLHQLGRERLVVVAEEQRGEAEAVDDVDEDEVHRRIAEAERRAEDVGQRVAEAAERAEDRRHRQQHRLERDEAGEQHQPEHQLVAAEAPLRQHVAVERAEQRRDRDGRNHHLDGVPEVALDAGAGEPDAGLAPGLHPRLEASGRCGSASMLPDWISSIVLNDVTSITKSGMR